MELKKTVGYIIYLFACIHKSYTMASMLQFFPILYLPFIFIYCTAFKSNLKASKCLF